MYPVPDLPLTNDPTIDFHWKEYFKHLSVSLEDTYDDMYPSSAGTVSGPNAPSVSAYTGGLRGYEFVGSGPSLKELGFQFELPHKYREGTDVDLHVHIYVPNSAAGGTVKFSVEYSWNNMDTAQLATTTVSGTKVIAAGAGPIHTYLPIATLNGRGKQISSIIACRLFRDPTDPQDTLTESVWLKQFASHYQADNMGSIGRATKGNSW